MRHNASFHLLISIYFLVASSIKLKKPKFSEYSNLKNIITDNPISRIVSNTYSFFYWLPKRNVLYDIPWTFPTNSSSEFIAWNQIPHNLPPYQYIDQHILPEDFFCFGIPGNTLPLGNWDPWSFSQVSKKIVLRYRESEVKHSRLAMLGCSGCIAQELVQPTANINGLSISHMEQLQNLSVMDGILGDFLKSKNVYLDVHGVEFTTILLILAFCELFALVNFWTRWKQDEYMHQFDTNIGIGNLKEGYFNGNYGFDPLNLMPESHEDRKFALEIELNHGRLAMVAFLGILVQEYFLGKPIFNSLYEWINSIQILNIASLPVKAFEFIIRIPLLVVEKWSRNDFQTPTN